MAKQNKNKNKKSQAKNKGHEKKSHAQAKHSSSFKSAQSGASSKQPSHTKKQLLQNSPMKQKEVIKAQDNIKNNIKNNLKGSRIRIAVIWFPGTNCEEETARVVEAAGMSAEIIRWNSDTARLRDFDGYVLPGGWSYEDRIRAGVIVAKDPVLDVIKNEADKGKPVLGICNGAQILVEKGMVPATKPDNEIALAPNVNPLVSGYYCSWVYLKVENNKGAFTSLFKPNEVMLVPVAHGEGRFMTSDSEVKEKLRRENLVAFKYCDENGKILEKYPYNPNGSFANIAAVYNAKGNVLAIMPHPERAAWKKQIPGFYGTSKEGDSSSAGRKIFESMKFYIEKMKKEAKNA